jgi:peptide/nickel transport system ATP-binding protein
MTEAPLLSVDNLTVRLTGPNSRILVQGVSFDLGAECVALVGESGSGKSVTARAIMSTCGSARQGSGIGCAARA